MRSHRCRSAAGARSCTALSNRHRVHRARARRPCPDLSRPRAPPRTTHRHPAAARRGRRTHAALVEYYTQVGVAGRLPVLIYHIPAHAGVSMKLDTAQRTADRVPHLAGMKRAQSDLAVSALLLANGTQVPGLRRLRGTVFPADHRCSWTDERCRQQRTGTRCRTLQPSPTVTFPRRGELRVQLPNSHGRLEVSNATVWSRLSLTTPWPQRPRDRSETASYGLRPACPRAAAVRPEQSRG
jgi:Dihydrodipicolinate synthetase family